MMALLFVILLFTVVLAWLDQRKLALGCFSILILLATLYFYHHMYVELNLQL